MTVHEALVLAVGAHAKQRERTGTPYVFHLVRVAQQMDTDEERTVALLHDIIEDTTVTLEDLRADGLTEKQVDAVDRLTRRHGEDYFVMVERVKGSLLAVKIKIADIDDHLDIHRDMGKYQWSDRDALRVRRYLDARQRLVQVYKWYEECATV